MKTLWRLQWNQKAFPEPGHGWFLLTALFTLNGLVAFGEEQFHSSNNFEKQVRPLLANKCWECHGKEKQKGGLRLDSAAGVAKGGASGPVIVPGNPGQSKLLQAVGRTGKLKMPPQGALSPKEIKAIEEWIQSGARWADEPPTTASGKVNNPKNFWAFQPIQDYPLSKVKRASWALTPVDHFLLGAMEKAGLQPAQKADRRALIRRVTFDLIGLPPTVEELENAENDPSPDWFHRVVDRLLDSPHYGERWGRHWLDVVRYADSTANDANAVMRYAYRYRDYVVTAFNTDKPYDKFIVEQVAGDLLPYGKDEFQRADQVIATGFLMVGPKALAETDKEQSKLDVVDDQIDVLGRSFLGITLSCARCHDHKYDPVSIRDYYGLAGIFRSTEVFLSLDRNASNWQERQLPLEGKTITVMAPKEAPTVDLPIHLRGNRFRLGDLAPRGLPGVLSQRQTVVMPKAQSGRLELARWVADKGNPLTARVMVNRIWQHHFGKGLVPTSDNFGARGDLPSHPELLDWLASRFIESGWSIKSMHRLLLHSSAYQMSTQASEPAKNKDPDNRLLHHMPRKRLEAEAQRDAMLAVSGALDRELLGDRALAVAYEAGEQIGKSFRANRVTPSHPLFNMPCRSIYLPVIRNALPDVLSLFDAADPNGVTAVRNVTTVPSQTLFLLNNPFVRDQAQVFARSLLEKSGGLHERLKEAWQRALGRKPSLEELQEAENFLRETQERLARAGKVKTVAEVNAWQNLCQALFCSNEFLYLE